MKSCGRCTYFIRLKQMQGNNGICDYYDCRTNCDHGRNCPDWKGIKYKRNKEKNMKAFA